MKTLTLSNVNSARGILLSMIFVLEGGLSRAQSPSLSTQHATGDYAIIQVGPHSRVWGNSAGQSVTEISTGMNFWNGQQWSPSNPSFVVSADGTAFVAAQIQDPTQLAGNLNVEGAVTVTTPDNVTLRSTPIAIGLYDAATGLSLIVASLTNTTGVLVDPQHVVYDKAFVGGGFSASVVYSLPDRGSFHQDVVFTGFDQPFDPTVWGFAADSTNSLQIQIFTEFYNSPPQPLMQTNYIYVEQNPAVRAAMASPDLIDYTLDFGDYVFGWSRAYAQTASTTNDPGAEVLVLKDFVTSSGRTFLVESIPYKWLAAGLQALPRVVAGNSLPQRPFRATRKMMAAASLPRLRELPKASGGKIIPGKNGAVAAANPRGVVVDYIVTVSSTVEPTLYAADTTYFVSGPVYNTAPVRMESAVFKYPTNTGGIELESTLTMATTNYRPAIFTAADDNTAGTTLSTAIWSGYTGNPTGYYGYGSGVYGGGFLYLNATGNIALNNLRFCYASQALTLTPVASGQAFTLSDVQLVDDHYGVVIGNGSSSSYAASLTLNNCLMGYVRCAFVCEYVYDAALTCAAYNCTIDSGNYLVNVLGTPNPGVFSLTNSIYSSVSNLMGNGTVTVTGGVNAIYNSPTFGSYTPLSSSPYVAFGAGNYYLPSTSSLLTLGTTNVGAALLAQLQMKTTLPPLTLTNTLTNYTVLYPVAQRDTMGTALGFHFDPIDYLAEFAVSNTTLLLTNGVALAYYDDLGIWLQDSSQLVSQGTPNYRNYLVYYNMVQEEPTALWTVSNAIAQVMPIAPLPYSTNNKPSIYMRLTTIVAPQGQTNLWNTTDTNQVIASLGLRDCEIYGAGANWLMRESNNIPLIGLTNNVFHRVPVAVTNDATLRVYNNLFYGTTNTNEFAVVIQARNTNTAEFTIQNNVFDGLTAALWGTVGYNAYLHGGTNTTIQGTDIVTNLTWLAGPLGAYYQTNTSPLLTNGSTYATNLGLYHYAVETNTVSGNEIVEGTNIVSRGYHYIALGSNGLPLDTSGDGVPDYLADVNGNGVVNSGEIDWLVSGDLGLTVIITQPANNTTIP